MTNSTPNQYSYLQIWLLASRPKTLFASFVPVLVAGVMAAKAIEIDFVTFGIILLTALLIQLATNYANDYFDFKKGADNHKRTGPIRVTQTGLLSQKEIKFGILLTLSLALLLGSYLVSIAGFPILIIGILALFFAVAYTAGPYPLAYNGLGDIFVFIFFGPVAVGGTYYILAGPPTLSVLLAGSAIGLISSAILVVNNLRDIETDSASGKKTLAVSFGKKFTQVQYLLLILIAALIPFIIFRLNPENPGVILASLYFLPALKTVHVITSSDNPEELNNALASTGKLLLLFGLLFSAGYLL